MQHKFNKGFTIVELLIVVVVIAILAAITIVGYNGIQTRARVSTAQSDLVAIQKQFEMYKTTSETSTYPTSNENTLWKQLINNGAGVISTSQKNFVICRSASGTKYTVVAWSPITPAPGELMYFVGSATNGISSVVYPGQGSYGAVSIAVCQAATQDSSGSGWAHLL